MSDAVTQSSEPTVGDLVEGVPPHLVTLPADVERHGVGEVLKVDTQMITSHCDDLKSLNKEAGVIPSNA